MPETEYHCRAVATNIDGAVNGQEGTFTALKPLEIGATWTSDVGAEAATLNAEVNPLGVPATTGYFEYVDEATYLKDEAELGPGHGFEHAEKAPDVDGGEEPLEFGASEEFQARSVALAGLSAGTAYRYRIVATDLLIAPPPPPDRVTGPTEAFRTYRPGEGGLPDGRAYELVSPNEKNSAEVAVPGAPGGLFLDNAIRIQAAAGSGEAITYTSWTSFGDAEGAPGASQYLSRRTPGGWGTEDISPFGFEFSPLEPPYRGFSPDLGLGALVHSEPSLAEGCPEGFNNLYLREEATGALRCLTPEAPSAVGAGFCLDYAGSSEDGGRAFFASNNSYAGAPEEEGFSLYEWSASEGLRVLSVLPGQSEAATPAPQTGFGERAGNCQTGQKTLRHVVSADGRRAFWTYAPQSEPSRLLVRVNGAETIQLDALPPKGAGFGPAGGGVFWSASADGSVAYFTDTGRLVSGSKAEADAPDLYRYELGKATPLTDLTKGTLADVQGVVGASDDGSYVYFVAHGVLSGAEEDSVGEKAQTGEDNLYAYHEGKARFVAILAPQDVEGAVSDQPKKLSARVSPDGRHLAFLSIEAQALAGYDNTIAEGSHCQLQLGELVEGHLVGGPLCSAGLPL